MRPGNEEAGEAKEWGKRKGGTRQSRKDEQTQKRTNARRNGRITQMHIQADGRTSGPSDAQMTDERTNEMYR